MKWRPFTEWKPNRIGIGFSFSIDRVLNYEIDTTTPEATLRPAHVWHPNVWIRFGPLIVGIGWEIG